MNKTKIVSQINGNDTRYAALTLNQLAKAMCSGWNNLGGKLASKQVRVEFASNTTVEDDVSSHHGLLLQAPFDSLILITGGYGGYDFGSIELCEVEDELGVVTEWHESYPYMNRKEVILLKALENVIWDEWKDKNGLLWCEVSGCIKNYIDTLSENELERINNT